MNIIFYILYKVIVLSNSNGNSEPNTMENCICTNKKRTFFLISMNQKIWYMVIIHQIIIIILTVIIEKFYARSYDDFNNENKMREKDLLDLENLSEKNVFWYRWKYKL